MKLTGPTLFAVGVEVVGLRRRRVGPAMTDCPMRSGRET
jgi:hypothetical protein